MKTTFRQFEVEAIKLLTKDKLSEELTKRILSHTGKSDYDYTGVGYYLAISEDWIPEDRIVLSEPAVVGDHQNIRNGFLAFIEDHQFVLECHDWSEKPTPSNFRDLDIQVSVIKFKSTN